ncbi:beta-propeller fold lactonase family protein [Fortiea sp. LEGE XX443]|uniref:lactonase family protein n=1 Tax=Fortiea sp. LEGE XX443 TaxID=1828611 RepID=UPI00187F090E|nr:beta-propeller fold lactonase family protein [Fortiea sp. LEGE XX443]MBE9005812.1 beta-propeller fold lactonase family protein [Fortiea sp. LEGE XX443]
MDIISKTSKAHRQRRKILLAMTGLTAVLLTGGLAVKGADAQWYKSGNGQSYNQTGFVYTQSNIPTPNGNSILGFRRDASGELTPLPTPSFPTGGAGIPNAPIIGAGPFALTSFASDQEVIVNPEQTLLFTVNSGSNTIAVFDIHKDGSLSPVEGSPFPSGGVQPVSLGLAGDILTVVNQNLLPQIPAPEASNSLPNYTTFRVTPKGKLIPIPNSTVSVPNGSLPTQALISPNKRLLFGVDGGTGLLRSFQILPNGRLQQSPTSPQPLPAPAFPPNPLGLTLGLQAHPQKPILYVGFTLSQQLGVYSYDQDGNLTFLKAVPNSGLFICWIVINRAATRLYTSNPGDNSVAVYDIAQDPSTPVEIQRVVLKGPIGGGSAQLTLDSTESFLHVVSQPITNPPSGNNGISVLKVNQYDGTLTEVPSSPQLIPSVNNSFPQGIVAN